MDRLMLSFVVIVCVATNSNGVSAQNAVETHWNADSKADMFKIGSFDDPDVKRPDAPKVAAKLIELGADIEAKDSNWGNTPLRWCCWWGVPEVAKVLVEAGAATDGASEMARSSKS